MGSAFCRIGRLAVQATVLFLLTSTSALAATIRVEAFINGHSQLLIKGNTAQWHHIEAAAPGGGTPGDPTVINGVAWFPSWPQPGENRDCNCYSGVFDGADPGLAAVDQTVSLSQTKGREKVTVSQQPAAANGYTAIIDFNDPEGGGDDYAVDLNFPQGIPLPPKPAVAVPAINGWGLFVLAALLIASVPLLRRKRRGVRRG
jgi:hypothetical protein